MVKNSIIVGLAIAVVVVVTLLALRPSVSPTVSPTTPSQEEVGAMAGPDNPYAWRSDGGVRLWSKRKDLANTTSTSTLCSFQAPAATSTLVAATMRIKNTTGANQFQVGRAAKGNSNATTTLLASLSVGSALYGELVSTTSVTQLTDGVVIPYSWINFKVASGTPGVVTWIGDCSVVFREL